MRIRSWPRVVAVALAACAIVNAGALLASGASCTATTTVNEALISGIHIDSSLLLGGIGCGTSNDSVYKYVAIVINNGKDIGGAGIFDCFADAVFANLPGTDAGSLNFAVWVYAYNETAFNKANDGNALTKGVALLNGVIQPDGSIIVVPANSVPDGGTTKGGYVGALGSLCTGGATWVSTCTAASQPGLDVSALCTPLALENKPAPSCTLPINFPDASHD